MKKYLSIIFLIFLFFTISANAAKNLYLSYNSVPKQVFKNQRFEVKIKAIITNKNFDTIQTSFKNANNVKVLNPQSSWKKKAEQVYENSFYFKADEKFTLPNFEIKLLLNNQLIEQRTLKPIDILFSDIAKGDQRFSNVIAKDLSLKAYKTKQYNNKESLTIIDIEAIESNLEDFKLTDIEEQGISKIKSENGKQNLIYYFVMPVHKKKVVFNYYNSSKSSLETVTIPLVLQNELVSTQTDLNPSDSNFEKYKKIAVGVVFLLFVILFIWKRNKIYLIISIILFIIAAIYLMPNQKGLVKKDSYIYILPTKNSTIFFKLSRDSQVEVLNKKNGFIKVIGSENKFIGWVKEENFGKN